MGFGQVGVSETVEGAIDEGSVDGQDPPEVGFASKLPGVGKAVGRALVHQGQDHPLGQRQAGCGGHEAGGRVTAALWWRFR